MTAGETTQTFPERHSDDAVRREAESFDLDVVYRTHAADVSRWLRQLARHDDVSDLLHEVFVVAQRRRAEFRGDATVRTWLYAIATRVVWSFRRKQRLRRLLFLEPKRDETPPEPVEPSTPFSSVASRHAAERVNRVLDRLSERDRTLIVLFELEGLRASEIQAILGLRANGVWVALHRARERFKRIFLELYGEKE